MTPLQKSLFEKFFGLFFCRLGTLGTCLLFVIIK